MLEVSSRFPQLADLTTTERTALFSKAEILPFQRNHRLWLAGEVRSQVALILDGRLKVVAHCGEETDLIVDLPRAGAVVGITCALEQPQPHSVFGLGQGFAAMIEWEHLLLVLGMRRMGDLLRTQRASADRLNLACIQDPSYGNEEARLTELLQRLAAIDGNAIEGGVLVSLPLSRQDLASLAGVPLECAIRVLSRWNREQVVLTTRNGLLIPSTDRLRAVFDRGTPVVGTSATDGGFRAQTFTPV